jgi:hypothetical protein
MRFPLLLAASLALAACDSDPTDGNPPPPQDAQPFDLAPDATDTGVDRPAIDVSDDRPAPIDNGPADAGVDVSFHTDPIPLADLGGDVGTDAGGDAADVASDQPEDAGAADARVNCQAATSVQCRTSAECAATCLPHTSTDVVRWCCIGGGELGECGGSLNTSCTRP